MQSDILLMSIEPYNHGIVRALMLTVILLSAFYIIYSGKLKEFFTAPGSALNLAIFRVVFYGFVSIGFLSPLYLFGLKTADFPWADLPNSARVSLPYLEWYVKNVPITENLANVSLKVIAITSFLCMIGFRPQIFGWIFLAATFYYNGIPNFFGKINHNHYILWFAAILPLSRCADAFSLDSWLHRKGILKLNSYSSPYDTRYGIPLRMVAILIGMIYFFPGFYKLWHSGLEWILSDNLRNQFYYVWLALGDWRPAFRIDRYPLLYKSAALLTILFELFFIFLIFSKKGKVIAFVSGALFHTSSWIFMRINFFYLLLCYVVFIDWEKILRQTGILRKKENEAKTAIMIIRKDASFCMGVILVVINSLFGAFNINSWPFSIFPKFDYVAPSETGSLAYYRGAGDKLVRLEKNWLSDTYTFYISREWEHRVNRFYADKDAAHLSEELEKLAGLWTKNLPVGNDSFFIYYEVISMTPDSFSVKSSEKLWGISTNELLTKKKHELQP